MYMSEARDEAIAKWMVVCECTELTSNVKREVDAALFASAQVTR